MCDPIIGHGGVCTAGGVHASSIRNGNASYTYTHGHSGLLAYTATRQVGLIQ